MGDGLITSIGLHEGDDGFVSIDGRKTYFDLFPTETKVRQMGVGVDII